MGRSVIQGKRRKSCREDGENKRKKGDKVVPKQLVALSFRYTYSVCHALSQGCSTCDLTQCRTFFCVETIGGQARKVRITYFFDSLLSVDKLSNGGSNGYLFRQRGFRG